MLSLAFDILTATVFMGSVLALLHLRGTRAPHLVGAVHGLSGLLGLIALQLALRGPPRGILTGVASFGSIATVLAAAALAIGLVILVSLRRRWRLAGLAITVHATLAVTAYVLLAAYVALG